MNAPPAVQRLLARSAKLKLYVMLRRTLKPDALPDTLEAHLEWMIGEEKRGRIFLSGPVAPREGDVALDGLTILRAASLEEAESIGNADPFVASGIVAYEMREWTVNEGCFQFNVTLSDSSVSL